MTLANAYAEALFSLVKDSGRSSKKLVAQFLSLLENRGHLRLLRSIIREIYRIEERYTRRNTVSVLSDKLLSTKEMSKIKKDNKEFFAEATVEAETDKHLIGGVLLKSYNKRLDATYRCTLLNLYEHFRSKNHAQ